MVSTESHQPPTGIFLNETNSLIPFQDNSEGSSQLQCSYGVQQDLSETASQIDLPIYPSLLSSLSFQRCSFQEHFLIQFSHINLCLRTWFLENSVIHVEGKGTFDHLSRRIRACDMAALMVPSKTTGMKTLYKRGCDQERCYCYWVCAKVLEINKIWTLGSSVSSIRKDRQSESLSWIYCPEWTVTLKENEATWNPWQGNGRLCFIANLPGSFMPCTLFMTSLLPPFPTAKIRMLEDYRSKPTVMKKK